ncbi:BMP family ABC transporter substrate-binding protein [uncultured Murdochiella sp.]|uniref:BMP family ABC transporter substrate-binding protein n=1 Tax=uncultured Murdochiella sp. TaxID=1586095 RepID=UPI0028065985|nr:BMP family ABC transporter substrate-binding protein [uncultured Murdochiella sp.]
MKKLVTFLSTLFVLALVLTACGGKNTNSEESLTSMEDASATTSEETSQATGEVKYDDNSLYLITDLGTIDDKSFNQGSFEGLKQFAEEIGVKANYLRPQDQGDQVYLQAIEQAIQKGAKIVVTPGFLFETAVGIAQKEHPDVQFIAVDFEPKRVVEGKTNEDGSPVTETYFEKNTASILFREQESGFLAGYAAVKDGYTKLGFAGGLAVPAVVRYGFGFIAGADYAAKEMNTKVEMMYNYTGSFTAKPEIQTLAATWYKNGTEIIFSCGGGIASSVLKAAQDNNGKMIGVDVDQKDMGEQVITSAMKNLQSAVYQTCKTIVSGEFKGGEVTRLSAAENGVQISDDFSRFKQFKEDEYKAIFEKIQKDEDGIAKNMPEIDPSLSFTEMGDPTLIMKPYTNITLNYVK